MTLPLFYSAEQYFRYVFQSILRRGTMKRFLLFSLVVGLVLVFSSAYAEVRGPSRAPLGFGNFALKESGLRQFY